MSGDKGRVRISAHDWEALYRKCHHMLRQYFASRGLCPACAEDLAQETFLELGQSKVPENPSAYILAIAKNLLAKHRRHEIAEHAVLEEYCRGVTTKYGRTASRILDAELPEETSMAEAVRILRAIGVRLPHKDMELVTLRFVQGLSIRQVAQRMGCSENAVSKRIARLRAILRSSQWK